MTKAPRATVDPRGRISLALVISILVHVATLWKLPQVQLSLSPEVGTGPLIVQLTPQQRPPPAPPAAAMPRQRAQPPPRPAPPPPRPKAVERPRPSPPVIARREPEAATVPQPRAPAVAPAPKPTQTPSASPPSAPTTDLASYVEARRRVRGETAAPAPAADAPKAAEMNEDENARANRIAAANLGVNKKPTFGSDPRKGGGIFDITRKSYDYAEFVFFGWNKDIRRNAVQTIDVRKGNERSIEIAIIRRMIVIIREHEDGDFIWESHRLNRNVTLSARPRDNAALEDFLWKEFFEDPRRPAQRP